MLTRGSLSRGSCAVALLVGGCAEAPPIAPAETAAAPPPPARVFFVDATAELGIAVPADRPTDGFFMPDVMGSGCALLDYDGDGDLDLYLVRGARSSGGAMPVSAGVNRLYRQEAGGRFVDVTDESGAGDAGYGMGAAAGDYDNDGDVDLYVTNVGPDRLYRNQGDGTFRDVTGPAGIDNTSWGTSAGFIDYDADGWLDLYVCNYVDFDPDEVAQDPHGRPEYPGPTQFDGAPDVLYRNRGDGTFDDVSGITGIDRATGKGLGVAFLDLSGDERLDVYVANDGVENLAWINDGRVFTEDAGRRGLATNAYAQSEASMGLDYGDLDRDGWTDLFVAHLDDETSTLYRQVGPGFFADATIMSGLGATTLPLTGFGAAALDVDLDGDLDLVEANGRVLRRPEPAGAAAAPHWPRYAEANQLFLNDGGGRFEDAAAASGAFGAALDVSRGLAVGDLDNDGDLDLVVTSADGAVRVYRHIGPRAGRWLAVSAIDPRQRRVALGAVVEVAAGGRILRRSVRATHSYLSSSDPRAHFGLGRVDSVDGVRVLWPGGSWERFDVSAIDRLVVLRRGEGREDGPRGP